MVKKKKKNINIIVGVIGGDKNASRYIKKRNRSFLVLKTLDLFVHAKTRDTPGVFVCLFILSLYFYPIKDNKLNMQCLKARTHPQGL